MKTKIIISIITVVAIILVVIGLRGISNQSTSINPLSNKPNTQEASKSQATESLTMPKSTQPSATDKKPVLDSSIQDLVLNDYKGKTVKLSDFAGKPLVINSWASWCPFCRQEIPDFVTAQKEFGDKVVIVAVNRQESLEVAKGYTDKQGTTNNLIFLLDPSDSFYQSIGGFSMPETIFVDKNGNIAEHKRGPMDLNEIRQKIQQLLTS
jgi:thiol-disulfide isomerase/thioredoxin